MGKRKVELKTRKTLTSWLLLGIPIVVIIGLVQLTQPTPVAPPVINVNPPVVPLPPNVTPPSPPDSNPSDQIPGYDSHGNVIQIPNPDNSGHHLRWTRDDKGHKHYFWRDEDGRKHLWP